jgi:hypothetical protein
MKEHERKVKSGNPAVHPTSFFKGQWNNNVE